MKTHLSAAPHLDNELMIDWNEVFPEKTQMEIITIQSTYCMGCGGFKEIGTLPCQK